MFAYLKGAGASAFVATLGYLLFVLGTDDLSQISIIRSYHIALIFLISFNYLGCILGWLLLKFLTKRDMRDAFIETAFYSVLGIIFGLAVSFIFRLDPVFLFITMFGSVSFAFMQRLNNRVLSWIMVLIGPISTYITYCFFVSIAVA